MNAVEQLKRWGRRTLPPGLRRWLEEQYGARFGVPPSGQVDFGHLRRLEPLSRNYGVKRGGAIDRYYIEHFLDAHAADIRGRVLEIKDASYTKRFGGDRVTRSDVLHAAEGNPEATIVDDLTRGDSLDDALFDCIICTQTLLLIYDLEAAVRTLQRILKPGGVLLVTVPGITPQIIAQDWAPWDQYWCFTGASLERLFAGVFPAEHITVTRYGNVLSASAFLYGLGAGDLRPDELEHSDPHYQVIIGARLVKPGGPAGG